MGTAQLVVRSKKPGRSGSRFVALNVGPWHSGRFPTGTSSVLAPGKTCASQKQLSR